LCDVELFSGRDLKSHSVGRMLFDEASSDSSLLEKLVRPLAESLQTSIFKQERKVRAIVSFVVSKNVIFANGYGKQELFRQWSDRLFYLPHREPYAEGVGLHYCERGQLELRILNQKKQIMEPHKQLQPKPLLQMNLQV